MEYVNNLEHEHSHSHGHHGGHGHGNGHGVSHDEHEHEHEHDHDPAAPRRSKSSFRHARSLLSPEDHAKLEQEREKIQFQQQNRNRNGRQLHVTLEDNDNSAREIAPRIRTDCAQEGGNAACPIAWTDCYDGMNEGGGRILKLFKLLILPDESYCDYFRYY